MDGIASNVLDRDLITTNGLPAVAQALGTSA
jgi:hypothetical protein